MIYLFQLRKKYEFVSKQEQMRLKNCANLRTASLNPKFTSFQSKKKFLPCLTNFILKLEEFRTFKFAVFCVHTSFSQLTCPLNRKLITICSL